MHLRTVSWSLASEPTSVALRHSNDDRGIRTLYARERKVQTLVFGAQASRCHVALACHAFRPANATLMTVSEHPRNCVSKTRSRGRIASHGDNLYPLITRAETSFCCGQLGNSSFVEFWTLGWTERKRRSGVGVSQPFVIH